MLAGTRPGLGPSFPSANVHSSRPRGCAWGRPQEPRKASLEVLAEGRLKGSLAHLPAQLREALMRPKALATGTPLRLGAQAAGTVPVPLSIRPAACGHRTRCYSCALRLSVGYSRSAHAGAGPAARGALLLKKCSHAGENRLFLRIRFHVNAIGSQPRAEGNIAPRLLERHSNAFIRLVALVLSDGQHRYEIAQRHGVSLRNHGVVVSRHLIGKALGYPEPVR